MEYCTLDGESPVAESITSLRSEPSSMGHVESRVNQQGPPCKAKYSWVTNSEVVPETTGAVAKASLHRTIVTTYGPEPGRSIHDEDEAWVKLSGGERSALEGRTRASSGGRSGSENVGLSNVNVGENPMPRKPKGSSARFVHGGVRRGRENASIQCLSTRRYDAEVTHAILPGKARTTFNKRVPVPETDTARSPQSCKIMEVGNLMTGEPATEAPVNGGRNYNGPKTTCTWTERPYEASLFPGIVFGLFLRSLGGGRRRPPSGGGSSHHEIPLWKS
ncbi:hypothetical protein Lal_00015250 [Lupinus albus]|nr:hypothetical protein Lal_00015250 [Lupinus albus]